MSGPVALRRVARLVNGGTPTSEPKNWGDEVPWATPTDLAARDGGVLIETERSLTKGGAETGSAVVPAGSVVVSTRAPIGYVVRCGRAIAFNQGCRALVPTEQIDSRFLQHFLAARSAELNALGTGSTFQELSTEALASLPVYLPPPGAQRRIADFLDDQVARIDAVRKLIDARVELISERRDASLDCIVESFEQSHGTTSVRRLASGIEQGWSPECESSPALPGESGVIKLGAVRDGGFDGSQNKAFLEGTIPKQALRLADGDLLISRANTPALVGEAAVVNETGSANLFLCDLIYRINLLPKVSSTFVAAALGTQRTRALCRALARGTSDSMVKLRGGDILDLPIPKLEEWEMHRVGQRWQDSRYRSMQVLDNTGTQRALLEERKRALITAAVTGEFDVSSAGPRAAAAVTG